MLNDRTNVQRVTREVLLQAFGIPGLLECLAPCRLLGLLNWSLMGGVADLLRFFSTDLLPKLPPHAEPRRVFIDLADPTPRSREDLHEALATLRVMNRVPGVKVTLGLNLMEAEFVAAAVSLSVFKSDARTPDTVAEAAKQLRAVIDVDTVVIHPREGAAASTASGKSAWFDGPFCDKPTLSTGAGDHFNAGFALAQTLALPLDQCLALATATSGLYVREAQSPTPKSLSAFLRSLS
jgi:sugar/nucleoside kinase (ribokinase family)